MKVVNQFINHGLKEQSVVMRTITAADYLHCHKELQITWIIKGEGTLIIGDKLEQFKPNDIYFVGTNQPHFFRPSEGMSGNILILCLYFDPNKLVEVNTVFSEFESVLSFLELSKNGLKVPKQYQGILIEKLDKLGSINGLERFLQFIEMLNTCTKIINWKPLASGAYNYSFDVTERLNTIYNYTLQNYQKNITLNEIASVACMTPHAFCKYFKKHARKTYFPFLNEVRIGEACKRLVDGKSRNIASIAYETGFDNTITFNRVFRKIMNMTPSEYIEHFNFENLHKTHKSNRYA